MIIDHEKIARIKKTLKFKPRGMSISEIALQLHLNRNSVAKYLEILLMNGEVEAKKLGTSKVYTVSQRVPVSGWISFSSDMIVIINPEGQVLQANDSFLSFSGTTTDSILGKKIKDLNIPLFYDVQIENFLKESPEKKPEYFEISIEKNGIKYYFKGKLVPIIFDDGQKGILIIFEDISDSKHAEIALAEREKQYRAVIENIQDVFYRTDKNGNLIMASPSWASTLGYNTLEECLGKNIAESFYWDPEKRKQFLDEVYSKGRVVDYEVVLKTKNCQPFYVSTNSHLYFDNSGNILGVEGIFRDINERHASAEKIRSYIAWMEFFSKALQEFIELSPDADIFDKISNDLQSLVPGAMINVNSFNSHTGMVTLKSVVPQKDRKICEQILGMNISGLELPINSVALRALSDGHLHKMNVSLFDSVFGALPIKKCEQIEQLLNLGDNYCMGFAHRRKLFGAVAIYLYKGEKIADTKFFETYARTASIVLQRRLIQNSLRESEEIFQSVAQESPYPLAIVDDAGNFRYINRSFSRVFGYDSGDFKTGRQWFLLIFPEPEYRRRAIEQWKSDIAAFSEQGTIPREFVVQSKDGTRKNVIFRAVLLSNKEKCIICEDITDFRESEKTKKLLSCIVSSSNDAIIGKKIDGTIISWNRAAENMYGYSYDEILGKSISLIVPYERREELDHILDQISCGQGISNLETKRIKKDGQLIDVSVTISPIIDDTGMVIGASTISRDISSRKWEAQLKESEDRYWTLVDTIPTGIYYSTGDPKGKFIWGNKALLKILGISSLEKLQQIEIADLFAEPDGRRILLDDLKKTGFVREEEVSIKKADGNILLVSITAEAKIDPLGQIKYINGIVQDITDQKRTSSQLQVLQHELADIIEFLPDPTFVIDRDHRVIAWNSAIEYMTGVNKNQILGHNDFSHAFPFYGSSRVTLIDLIEESDDAIKNLYPRMKREGRSLLAEVFVPSLHFGKGAYLWLKASPLYDEDGSRIGAIEVIRDISEVKELQELLKNAKTGFISETLKKISNPGTIDEDQFLQNKKQTPGVLTLLYLSNALKMAHDSITILDLSGRCIWVNEMFARTISSKKNEILIGRSFAQFIAPEDRKIALDSLIEVRKHGNKLVALSLLTSSGRIAAEASLSSIIDNEDELLGYMTIIRNINQEKQKRKNKNMLEG
jgi:PAS domain S-box-containing protein